MVVMIENIIQFYDTFSPSGKEQINIGLFLGLVAFIGGLIYRNFSRLIKITLNILKKFNIKVLPHQQVLTFSVKHNDELNSGLYYEEIKKRFIKNLQDYNLCDVLTYKDFSDIVTFKNTGEAEAFRNKKDLSLILWGEFSNDHLRKEGDIESEFLLFFTYEFGHNKNNELQVRADFDKRIKQFLALKNKWIIRWKESSLDVAEVADGMFTVAVFTVGLSFLSRGKVEQSTLVFNELHKYLSHRTDSAAALLRPYVQECSILLVNKAIKEKNPNWQNVVLLIEKIIEITPKNSSSLVLLAYSLYKSGDKKRSFDIVIKLINFYPHSAAARVNLAFFQVLDGKYENALRNYKRVFNVPNPDFSTVEIIDFLSTEYNKTKEPGLLFASGAISYYHNGDIVLAKSDMKNFLSQATFSRYGNMFLEGRKILESIEKAT